MNNTFFNLTTKGTFRIIRYTNFNQKSIKLYIEFCSEDGIETSEV